MKPATAHRVRLLCAVILLLPLLAHAQYPPRMKKGLKGSSVAWRKSRISTTMLLGTSNYLGELGGRDQEGSGLFWDLDLPQTRYSVGFAASYKLSPVHGVRTTLSYARLSGSDTETAYQARQERNLHFRSGITELSVQYQWHFLRPRTKHVMAAPSSSLFDGSRLGGFFFIGIGGFYFNPKAEFDGQWIALQPLSTEGQGLAPDRKGPYSRIAISIPMGGALTFQLNSSWNLGLEYGLRLTSTDYLDDASTTYYNNEAILTEKGPQAAYLANPTLAATNDRYIYYEEGQRRGDPSKRDSYMFMQLSMSRTLGIHKNPLKTKQKRRKKGKRIKRTRTSKERDLRKARRKHKKPGSRQDKRLFRFKRGRAKRTKF